MTGAVLWDLDGTLVDSAELHWMSWRDTMEAEGLPIAYDQFLERFGQKNDRILGAWFGTDATAERIARVGDAKEAEYRRLAVARGITPLPGAAAWVERLHAQRWKQAIASSAPRLNVDVILRVLALENDFEAIVSAEDVTAGKPDPQVFLKAAEWLGAPPSRCIVVEDAPAGIEAARRAGMKCIGVSAVQRLDADIAVASLADLPDDAFEALLRGP
jgi:HAD superfamily hydrolase (TIGR01509 family)